MPIDTLPDAPGAEAAEPFAGPDHPIRIITRQIALERRWDAETRQRMSDTFDGLAPDWSEGHVNPIKAAPVRDALDRGDLPIRDARWLELGSGTGAGSKAMAARVERYVALDLSAQMIAHEQGRTAEQIRGDASLLPFLDDSFDAVMCINMFLFPDEVDRVLRGDGALLWVNTLGDQTPIHLPVGDVVEALPGSWSAVTANAGTGFWAVVRRD